MFKYVLSDEIKKILKKLPKKDKQLNIVLNKKIKQICSCDVELIDHYKNLQYDMSNYKRAHVGKSFILAFNVDKKNKIVYFSRFRHHDKAYK